MAQRGEKFFPVGIDEVLHRDRTAEHRDRSAVAEDGEGGDALFVFPEGAFACPADGVELFPEVRFLQVSMRPVAVLKRSR